MAEFTETTRHITHNQHGTPVLAETHTNIIPLGIAHEMGTSESDLLEQYGISRAQLHAALSYFYENREAIRAYQAETERLLDEHAVDGNKRLDELRKRRQQTDE
ncbi:MAG: hypothetical protein L0154_22640 [Chloroflexi bacterium]|nr:hypothetical protein [Chloroflexota bacterium]